MLSYAVGLLIGNLPFVPVDTALSNLMVSATVPLAIMLLVLPADIVHWLNHAGSAILSYLCCIVAVTFSAVAGFYLFRNYTPEAADMAGMMIGIYTGGTPNMSAIGLSLGVAEETFILLNSTEIMLGGIYLLFLMSVAKPLLLKLLPPYQNSNKNESRDIATGEETMPQSIGQYLQLYGIPVLIAAAGLVVSLGISWLVAGTVREVIVILSVTTIGIALSFLQPVRKLKGSYPAGEYFLMIFCIAIGSLADFRMLMDASLVILLFVTFITVASILIHYFLAMILKIDVDTLIITSAAGIFSPAFVPAIAKAIDNEEIVISGLTTGLVGYAIGSYLGIMIAYLLG